MRDEPCGMWRDVGKMLLPLVVTVTRSHNASMLAMIVGGIGLFLLGMMLMTDGLRTLAGDALRSILERFVRGPLSGLAWGTGITALIQSSSATTLMTIGFVSAGLLTFNQSLGVIFGANIGTTSTGWIVSTVGLKLSMSAIALPIVGIGAMVRLLGGERIAPIGTALCGFGLLFIGIDTLQAGMETLAQRIDPASFPGITLVGLPLLILIGAVMTVVMQSSSAAIATTLAALYTQAITLDQAAVLVIGQNIGTSVKAILASIGASIPARRTAIAHTLFNLLTAIIALGLLPLFLYLARRYADGAENPDVVSLAIFHTGFNIVGVAVFLPLTSWFASLVIRLTPEPRPALTRNLDPSVIEVPSVAVEAVRRTLVNILRESGHVLAARMHQQIKRPRANQRIDEVQQALMETQKFLGKLSAESSSKHIYERQLSTLHATDHLNRLLNAMRGERVVSLIDQNEDLRTHAEHLLDALATPDDDALAGAMEACSQTIAQIRKTSRVSLLEQTAAGKLKATESVRVLEAFLWLDRVAYHFWRAAHHLQRHAEPEAQSRNDAPDSN